MKKVLVLAAEDTDEVLRATARTEFAEEPGGIVITNGRSGVHTTAEHANAHNCSPYRCQRRPWRCGDGWKLA
jgi:hypothetical protein